MVITNFWGTYNKQNLYILWGIYNKQNLYILCLVPKLAEYFRFYLLFCNLEFWGLFLFGF